MSALPASIRWTAPEVLANPRASEDHGLPNNSTASFQIGALGPACDVYSFSMLLWELVTSTDPFEDITDERQASDPAAVLLLYLCDVHAFSRETLSSIQEIHSEVIE